MNSFVPSVHIIADALQKILLIVLLIVLTTWSFLPLYALDITN